MPRNLFTFVNHACFMVRTDSALLLVDPWLEGPAFNNGWSLLDQSTSNAALIAQLNQCGLPVFIWYTREYPDHFSLPFIRRFKGEFRGIATFLYRETSDKRVASLLRRNRFAVAECVDGVTNALGPDMRITVFASGDGSAGLINCAGRTILNLNDCTLATASQCRALKARVDRCTSRIDLMLTQFGYADWIGNPDEPALRRAAARERIERMALQIRQFKPRLTVPFASFACFSHPDNCWLNEGQNTPAAVVEALQLEGLGHTIRFLQPGATFNLDADTAASLGAAHERALAHWMGLWKQGVRPTQRQKPTTLAEVKTAFLQYRERMDQRFHALPRVLEFTRRIVPLVIYLTDLKQTVQASYRLGFRVVEPGTPFHIALSSVVALYLFRNEDGFETTHAGGCFRIGNSTVKSDDGLRMFRRFFLPQRMARRGYDRRPLAMGRFLLRTAMTLAARQVQTALR
jgi:hypothetical protein